MLSAVEVKEIVSKIESGRLSPSFKTHREQIKHIKNIVGEKQSSIACPKCGNPMVMREIKKGPKKGNKFWGCSRFPQCRGIANST